jgi:hypothetical protein
MIVAIVAGGTGGSLFSIDPEGWSDDDGRHHGARDGIGSGAGTGPAYYSLFFVGMRSSCSPWP